MSTPTFPWPDLPNISLRTMGEAGGPHHCAIHWDDGACINMLYLPDKTVALVKAAPNLPDPVVLALGRTIAKHHGVFAPGGDFAPGNGNGVTRHPPVTIPWGDKTREVVCCTIHQDSNVARLFIVSDPQIPSAGMQFKSEPTEDMWRTIARLLLQHRASLPAADEGTL